jgi:Reverse transcriptase (RNA-dependent DNA polymerase)
LSNFYDSVRLDILERWIREESDSSKGWIITLLFYLLNQWNRRNTGLHPQAVGLPQDALADCSRILANFYLQKYDKFASAVCTSEGALYFRYADDQMILTNDPKGVETLLLLLTRHLDRYGLRVNQKKVHFWTASELEAHRCRGLQAIFAQKGDNNDPKRVREFVNRYVRMSRSDLQRSWNQGLPLLNRLLYSNLESLPGKLFKRVVRRFVADNL